MRVQLSKVSPEPLHKELHGQLARLERLAEVVGPQAGQVEGRLAIRRVAGGFLVEGRVKAALSVPCDRCLEPVAVVVDEPVAVELRPEDTRHGLGGEAELFSDDLDVSFYTGDEVDLLELAEEQLLLGLPAQTLCGEECKGLCPQCGKNLNQGPCACTPDTSGSPFAQMAQWVQKTPRGDKKK